MPKSLRRRPFALKKQVSSGLGIHFLLTTSGVFTSRHEERGPLGGGFALFRARHRRRLALFYSSRNAAKLGGIQSFAPLSSFSLLHLSVHHARPLHALPPCSHTAHRRRDPFGLPEARLVTPGPSSNHLRGSAPSTFFVFMKAYLLSSVSSTSRLMASISDRTRFNQHPKSCLPPTSSSPSNFPSPSFPSTKRRG